MVLREARPVVADLDDVVTLVRPEDIREGGPQRLHRHVGERIGHHRDRDGVVECAQVARQAPPVRHDEQRVAAGGVVQAGTTGDGAADQPGATTLQLDRRSLVSEGTRRTPPTRIRCPRSTVSSSSTSRSGDRGLVKLPPTMTSAPSTDGDERPVVTVILITYNHEAFIEQALRACWSNGTVRCRADRHRGLLDGPHARCDRDVRSERLAAFTSAHPGEPVQQRGLQAGPRHRATASSSPRSTATTTGPTPTSSPARSSSCAGDPTSHVLPRRGHDR